MKTIINPVINFLSGNKRENMSSTTASLELLLKKSSDTFNKICQNLENVEKEGTGENEVGESLKRNQYLSRNLTQLTNSTHTEILRTMRKTRDIEDSLDNVRRLNNLSKIAAQIEILLQNHFEVEQERLKEIITGRGPIQISIQIDRGQLAVMMRVFVEKESEVYKQTLSGIKQIKHPIWACLTFAIMLGPGLVVCFYMVTSGFLKSITPIDECPKWFQRKLFILGIITSVFFPVGILLTQVYELFIIWLASMNTDPSQKKDYENMLKTIRYITLVEAAIEAFFESVPQLVLQTYIIAANKEASTTQIITITFSMVMLAKTTIFYDLMYNSTEVDRMRHRQPVRRTVKYLLAVLPLYVTSAIFKVSIFHCHFLIVCCVVDAILVLLSLLRSSRLAPLPYSACSMGSGQD